MIRTELVDHMGDDLSVVNAARVSFNKESEWEWEESGVQELSYQRLSDKDARLIQFLARHNHELPFAHTAVTLRVKAPIFVARQAYRSKIGFVENEVSRRYVSDSPEFYIPKEWRQAAKDKKQGSGGSHPDSGAWHNEYLDQADQCVSLYEDMIWSGIAPEQARMILPQSMMTEWIWTGSLLAYSRFYNLRIKEDAQVEIQLLAQHVGNIVGSLFPVSWLALTEGK